MYKVKDVGLVNNRNSKKRKKSIQKCVKMLLDVETIAKFAQMEFKYGEPERGKTMFENVLNNYGKRNDLWMVYAAMVTSHGEIDNARLVCVGNLEQ